MAVISRLSHALPDARSILVTISFLALLFLGERRIAAQDLGYVLDLKGRWRAVGNHERELAKGSAVQTGDSVRLESPHTSDAYILLVGRSGRPLERIGCGDPAGCEGPRHLDHLVEVQASAAERFLQAVLALWKDEPERYVMLGSRGGPAALDEHVLPSMEGKADLQPLVGTLAPGRYRLQLTPVHPEDRAGFGTVEEELSVGADTRVVPPSFAGVPEGLYEAEIVPLLEDGAAGVRGSSWVLVASGPTYQDLAQRFDRALEASKDWGDRSDASVRREFLRACLEFLAGGSVR